jgi:hypothetical protein
MGEFRRPDYTLGSSLELRHRADMERHWLWERIAVLKDTGRWDGGLGTSLRTLEKPCQNPV